MLQLSNQYLTTLMADLQPPCVSLYQPTHRRFPDNQQDPIRFRNMLREMESSLGATYPARDIRALLAPFEALARDNTFWKQRTDGLAILSSPGHFHVFELQRVVPERLVVADSFHTKPLWRVLQSADRYQVLCVNRSEARLYEGNRDALDAVELVNVPSTITVALGKELTEPHQAVRTVAAGQAAVHHGRGQKKDEVDVDVTRFFRVIDRAILEHHSRPSGLPLILAALPEYHAPFRDVSHNQFLMPAGIQTNPWAMDPEELRAAAWEQMEPIYRGRLARLIENFENARARDLGSDNLARVAEATVAGRVAFLLAEAERVVPGKIDPGTGRIEPGDLSQPEIDDVLDDLAEMVLRKKGDVVVIPAERMPTTTGVAAMFRF